MISSGWKDSLLACAVIGLSACAVNQAKRPMLFKAVVFDEVPGASSEGGYVDTIEIDEEEGVVRYDSGRIIMRLSDCGDDTWKCISDGHLEFAVRRDWRGEDRAWSYRSMTYSVIQEFSETLELGRDKAYFILASPKEQQLSEKVSSKIFLYSMEKGIIGLTMFLQGHDEALVPATYIRTSD